MLSVIYRQPAHRLPKMGSKSGALHGFGAKGKPTASWPTTGRGSWGMNPVANYHGAGLMFAITPLRHGGMSQALLPCPVARGHHIFTACFTRLTVKHLNVEYILTLNRRVVRFNAQ